MLINALRFRDGDGPWTAFRVSPGTGRFRNYVCLAAPEDALRKALAAVTFALTGKVSALVSEVELTLSDDGGAAWTVRRMPGEARIAKDGAELGRAGAERQLLAALLDIDLARPGTFDADYGADVAVHRIVMQDTGIQLAAAIERAADAGDALKVVAERQIREIATACAQAVERPALENAALLAKVARVLEPLHVTYRELCAQYREVKDADADAGRGKSTPDSDADAAALRAELHLIREIAQTAEPLLKPGASLKAWTSELAAAESHIAEISARHDLGDGMSCPDDVRKAIDALAKLEAHARLIRAAQAARKQCDTDVEPILKQYWDLIGKTLAKDRRIADELEGCLHSLSARMREARERAQSHDHGDLREAAEGSLKTWFDKFRSKHQEDEARRETPADPAADAVSDLETARMTVQFALQKLGELTDGLEAARPRFAGTLKRFDDAYEDIVKNYGGLKKDWAEVAKESGLPETMTLDGLLKFVGDHARLHTLLQKRAELADKVRDGQARLGRLGRLVPEWRHAAGSQKASDLANPQLLLQEARDVIRYQEAKERRLTQLVERSAEAGTQNNLKSILRGRRKAMLAEWKEAFGALGVAPVDINHEGLLEVFRRASIVRALGLVVGSAGKAEGPQPFTATPGVAASGYLMTETRTTNPARLALLSALEEARGQELRLLLVADDALAAMLGTLGIGMSQRVATARAEPPSAPPELQPPHTPPSRARGTVSSPTESASAGRPAAVSTRPVVQAKAISATGRAVAVPLLTDKARNALDILTGKKGN